eukprot:3112596-Pyramimonas_sp.AAC.2
MTHAMTGRFRGELNTLSATNGEVLGVMGPGAMFGDFVDKAVRTVFRIFPRILGVYTLPTNSQ